MNISFKATIHGLGSENNYIAEIFQYKTQKDKKHEIKFLTGEKYGSDTFVLMKNGVKTAEYKTDFSIGSLDKLMKIYRILTATEALNIVKKNNK